MWPNPRETADLVTFTEEIPNGKLHFCAVWRLTTRLFLWKAPTQMIGRVLNTTLYHYVKRVRIQSFSGPYFSTFGLNVQSKCGKLLRISPYSVWMRENTDQKNFKYGRFSRNVRCIQNKRIRDCIWLLYFVYLLNQRTHRLP